MEAKNIIDVEKFVLASNEMLTGKFLDLNKKLGKFLSVMTKSEDVMGYLSECLENFDEEVEFSKAFSIDKKTGAANVVVPNSDKKKVALFVTIFNNIINEKLNQNQFLETYFQDKKMTTMQVFLNSVVRPFRDIIAKHFNVSVNITSDDVAKHIEAQKLLNKQEPELVEEEKEDFPYLGELLTEVSNNCERILAVLKFEKKRTDVLDDVEFVVNSIIKACEKQDLMVVNGLVIGLNYVSKKFKSTKALVEELNNMIYNYYDFLSGEDEDELDDEEY